MISQPTYACDSCGEKLYCIDALTGPLRTCALIVGYCQSCGLETPLESVYPPSPVHVIPPYQPGPRAA